jgi:hypothetical protein
MKSELNEEERRLLEDIAGLSMSLGINKAIYK